MNQQNRRSHDPGIYRITIKGRLNDEWAPWFEGMSVSYEKGATVLTGHVADQSALYGIINRMRDLNLTLISLYSISEQED